jgi:hypothetical protein
MVVNANAVVNPGAMATSNQHEVLTKGLRINLLIFLCNTSLAHFTMFTSQGSSGHASSTEMLFVELSCFK